MQDSYKKTTGIVQGFEAGAKKVIPQTDDKQYINTANIANSRHLKYQKVVFEYVVQGRNIHN